MEMKGKMYVIGVDFGTESGRVLIVDVRNGAIAANHVTSYPHGVMDAAFFDGSPLPDHWALQHPGDYLHVLRTSVPITMQTAGIHAHEVIGLGLDFTASTILPVQEDGTPLCFVTAWQANPHAYVKLWKHHAAQKYAEEFTQAAKQRGETFLDRYGGTISSEWMFPKILQILREAPEIYDNAARFIEAGDWVVWQLTGQERRSACSAGYKACWDRSSGYPSTDFLSSIDSRLDSLMGTRIPTRVHDVGTRAGGLTHSWAQILGLVPNIPVSVSVIDAHASVPAVGVHEPGHMVIAMGTSFCHMLLGEHHERIPGIAGAVADGILPGYVGYEAGQAAGGDLFAWFLKKFAADFQRDRDERESERLSQPLAADLPGPSDDAVFERMTQRAQEIPPGGTGLIALDWMNGNRSILMDATLSGVIAGFTLSTKAEEVYRALLEAVAYGTRVIVEAFETNGLSVQDIHACGGVATKNPLLMQILADVTKKKVYVNALEHAPAVGAAILAAVAVGAANGGYDAIEEAVRCMASTNGVTYEPNPGAQGVYDVLYKQYCLLHDWFGREHSAFMKVLKQTRNNALHG
ncbi:ribulokinase [Alicyclobacillus tolerans]|nr:ribulokinase [Alicyclobacillus tolerans]MCF8565036.1 ribulokinase [Alicyclobacillus tolerans]